MKRLRLPLAIGTSAILASLALAPVAGAAVCWFEGRLFRTLLRDAPRPDDRRIAGIDHVERLTIPAADATQLNGFLLPAAAAVSDRRLLLFAQGDATLADEMLASLTKFQSAGYDVFVFDYRGFGRSKGTPSIAAIEQDYEAIIAWLRKNQEGRRFYYGVSGGGVILLRALREDQAFAGLALDSTPSRMPVICDSEFDPVNNVPAKADKLLVIQGKRDENIPPPDSERLASMVRARGGHSILIDVGHPAPDLLKELDIRFDAVLRHFGKP